MDSPPSGNNKKPATRSRKQKAAEPAKEVKPKKVKVEKSEVNLDSQPSGSKKRPATRSRKQKAAEPAKEQEVKPKEAKVEEPSGSKEKPATASRKQMAAEPVKEVEAKVETEAEEDKGEVIVCWDKSCLSVNNNSNTCPYVTRNGSFVKVIVPSGIFVKMKTNVEPGAVVFTTRTNGASTEISCQTAVATPTTGTNTGNGDSNSYRQDNPNQGYGHGPNSMVYRNQAPSAVSQAGPNQQPNLITYDELVRNVMAYLNQARSAISPATLIKYDELVRYLMARRNQEPSAVSQAGPNQQQPNPMIGQLVSQSNMVNSSTDRQNSAPSAYIPRE